MDVEPLKCPACGTELDENMNCKKCMAQESQDEKD